jgi:hypothetical protein
MPKDAGTSEFWRRLAEMVGKDFPANNQAAVGKLFSVGQSAVTKWKTGKDTPALPRAIEMAKEYGVCVEWLLTGRGPKHPGDTTDPALTRLLEFWQALSPATKNEVIEFAAFKRTKQSVAPLDRIKDVHEKLPNPPKKTRRGFDSRVNRSD